MNAIGEQLWIEHGDGAARAHRVVPLGPVHLADVGGKRRKAVLVRKIDSIGEGSIRIAAAELTKAAPLSAADEAEYRRLDRKLAGTFGDATTLARFNALRLRSLMFQPESRA